MKKTVLMYIKRYKSSFVHVQFHRGGRAEARGVPGPRVPRDPRRGPARDPGPGPHAPGLARPALPRYCAEGK